MTGCVTQGCEGKVRYTTLGMCVRCYKRHRYASDPKHRAERLSVEKERYRGQRETRLSRLRAKYATDGDFREAVRKKNVVQKLRAYGLTLQRYEEILAAQGGCCAICREVLRESKATHVDHCHTTGRVRGVLCFTCNTGIGKLKDRIDVMKAAVSYLERDVDWRVLDE